jgi:hypothetical protein
VNPAAPIAAGETAGRVAALETTRAGAHSRRRVNGVKAASTRPSGGMHSTATAETSATVKTAAGMHAAAMETSATAVKAATTAVEASTATTVEAATATAMEAAATATVEAAATTTTAMGACLCRVCEHEPCDRAREDRGERKRNLFAGSSQHVFLHPDGARRLGTPAVPGDALGKPWGSNKFRRRR